MKHILSIFFIALAAWCATAQAGPGDDHGGAPPPAQADAPRRLPSGDVFLPKPAQRKLGLRTLVAATAEHPRAFELNGRVVADPNAGGQVQSTQTGRLLPGPKGLPALGGRVARGDVLGFIEPAIGAVERGNQSAQLADLRAQLDSAHKRRARLEQLEGAVPQKDIDAARIDVTALTARVAAVAGALGARETLRAPVAGVVSAVHAVNGQVVDARQVLFEVVDPARLMVEALAYDDARATGIASASIGRPGGGSIALRFIGAAAQLREQALPLMFRVEAPQERGVAPQEPGITLAVNQPVRVAVQTTARQRAIAVPAAALARSPSNETIVWVHTSAETFAPRVVRATPLDGARVAVTVGINDGDRVVVEGAQLLGQVR